MPYRMPSQQRGIETEKRLLDAFEWELREKGFQNSTIDSIAFRAGASRAVFLKRFGSKENALLLLFRRYCEDASAAMQEFLFKLNSSVKLEELLNLMSIRFALLLQKHYASNRAMREHFQKNLVVHDLTKKIFLECVNMMLEIKKAYEMPVSSEDVGAWSAAQLLVSLNYDYITGAMPGMPRCEETRHKLISQILCLALKT